MNTKNVNKFGNTTAIIITNNMINKQFSEVFDVMWKIIPTIHCFKKIKLQPKAILLSSIKINKTKYKIAFKILEQINIKL